MTDRPILFSAPMIQALLAGRKHQTRRLIKIEPKGKIVEFVKVGTDVKSGRSIYEMKDSSGKHVSIKAGKHFVEYQYMPPFAVSDRLWVRETWAPLSALKHNDPGTQALIDGGFYRADDSSHDDEIDQWRPSMFMPRWASRLTLIVEDIRVERLQDIAEEDAIAEGILPCPHGNGDQWVDYPVGSSAAGWASPIDSYRSLWDIHQRRGYMGQLIRSSRHILSAWSNRTSTRWCDDRHLSQLRRRHR
jgi:hypothetical protein